MHRAQQFAVLAVLFGLSGVLRAQDPFAPYNGVYGYSETDNIVYGSGAVNGGASNLALTLDMFQPTNIGVPVPAVTAGIILIHGGSFVSGDKSDLDYLAHIYATHGYSAVSINYRLIGNNPPITAGPSNNAINVAVQDAETAMGWMRDNSATYQIDPSRVAIGGFSAGAITALFEAYNSPPARYAPTAVLDFSGGMYGNENLIHAGAPPAFVFHGTADPTVPYANALNLVNQLNAVGVYNFFQPWVGGDHEINLNAVDAANGETMYQNNMDFLAAELAPLPPPLPEPSTLVLAGIGCIALLAVARRRSMRDGAPALQP